MPSMDLKTATRALLVGLVVLQVLAGPVFASTGDDTAMVEMTLGDDEVVDLSELVEDMKDLALDTQSGPPRPPRSIPGFCTGFQFKGEPTRCPPGSWWSGREMPDRCRKGGGRSSKGGDYGGKGRCVDVDSISAAEAGEEEVTDSVMSRTGGTRPPPPPVQKFSISDFCVRCSPGTYQPGSNCDRSCLPCPVGTFGPQRGLKQCVLCPAGTANPNEGAHDFDDCKACPAGTFAPFPGTKECIPCPKGTFSDRKGSKGCDECLLAPAGSDKCPYKVYDGVYGDFKF